MKFQFNIAFEITEDKVGEEVQRDSLFEYLAPD
jgi:hypothetical protein